MENRKIADRITREIIAELNPNHAADDRRFTKAARHCGLSRKALTRIYIEHWCTGMGRRTFADLILQGRLVYCKDAHGDFYGTERRNWYHRKDGTTYYFRGQFKGRVLNEKGEIVDKKSKR